MIRTKDTNSTVILVRVWTGGTAAQCFDVIVRNYKTKFTHTFHVFMACHR